MDPSKLSNKELRVALSERGLSVGPVTATTRSVFEKKLISLLNHDPVKTHKSDLGNTNVKDFVSSTLSKAVINGTHINDDGSDSDEPFKFDKGNRVIPGASSTVRRSSPPSLSGGLMNNRKAIANTSPSKQRRSDLPSAGTGLGYKPATPPSPSTHRGSIYPISCSSPMRASYLASSASSTLDSMSPAHAALHSGGIDAAFDNASRNQSAQGSSISAGYSSFANRLNSGSPPRTVASSFRSNAIGFTPRDLNGWRSKPSLPTPSPPGGHVDMLYRDGQTHNNSYGVSDDSADEESEIVRGTPPKRVGESRIPGVGTGSETSDVQFGGGSTRRTTDFGSYASIYPESRGSSMTSTADKGLSSGIRSRLSYNPSTSPENDWVTGRAYATYPSRSTEHDNDYSSRDSYNVLRGSMEPPLGARASFATRMGGYDNCTNVAPVSSQSGAHNRVFVAKTPSKSGTVLSQLSCFRDMASRRLQIGMLEVKKRASWILGDGGNKIDDGPKRWGQAAGVSRLDASRTGLRGWDSDFDERDNSWSWTAQSSHTIVKLFAVFVLLLLVGYVGTVHSEKVVAVLHAFGAASHDTLDVVYRNMLIPLVAICAGLLVVTGVFFYVRNRWHTRAEEERLVNEMIENIIQLCSEHAKKCAQAGKVDDYLIIPHVRDMLIKPDDRKYLKPIWDKAVKFLEENESRIQKENQIVSGEDLMVWRWLNRNEHLEEAASRRVMSPRKEVGGGKRWMGNALIDSQLKENSLREPYSNCLKARGLFKPSRESSPTWVEEVEAAILQKVCRVGSVVHLAVDTISEEGCVFLKCSSKEDAFQVYKALHGNWFDGKLVAVKFMRLEKYSQRFPESVRATKPLTANTVFL